ncbi:MAG: porin family protein [Prolixibacteraceae bacterium]|nr:porin family protein [Prolixibacteraceae bacterium]
MMKKIVLIVVTGLFAISLNAQTTFDLGFKGGANFSKISFDADDYSSETALKTHFGAFARLGWDRIFLQPEVYFSGKGGNLKSGTSAIVTSFDYNTVDVPVLLGIKLIKGKAFDLHIVGGPVFSGITTKELDNENTFNEDFYENHYFGVQYGVGVDVLFLTFDARMEQGLNQFYNHFSSDMKNNTFMLSVGFKFL